MWQETYMICSLTKAVHVYFGMCVFWYVCILVHVCVWHVCFNV